MTDSKSVSVDAGIRAAERVLDGLEDALDELRAKFNQSGLIGSDRLAREITKTTRRTFQEASDAAARQVSELKKRNAVNVAHELEAELLVLATRLPAGWCPTPRVRSRQFHGAASITKQGSPKV